MGLPDIRLWLGLGDDARARGRAVAGTSKSTRRCQQLLAALLQPVAPDTAQDTAARLIERFGSLPAVLAASPYALREVVGNEPAVRRQLRALRSAEVHLRRVQIQQQPMLGNWSALLDYVRAMHAFGPIEELRVLYLNTRNILIRDELMAKGSIDQAPMYVREIVRRGLELHSAAMILVHNHPSGDPKPSRADVETTRLLARAAQLVGLHVQDHLIIAAQGHSSMKSLGLL